MTKQHDLSPLSPDEATQLAANTMDALGHERALKVVEKLRASARHYRHHRLLAAARSREALADAVVAEMKRRAH